MEVAEKISKEAGAKQFSMCMTDDNELNRILQNSNLDEFELLVIGSPRENLMTRHRRARTYVRLPLWIRRVHIKAGTL